MADTRKVIITCAVTGSIHTPTMTPYIPITPDEIAAGAIGAAEAGAAILHLHARDPNDGRPTPDPKVFMQFLPKIKAGTDADRAVIDYTDAMTRSIEVPEGVFAAVRRHFAERETVELTATIAAYNLVSRFLEAVQVDHDA